MEYCFGKVEAASDITRECRVGECSIIQGRFTREI